MNSHKRPAGILELAQLAIYISRGVIRVMYARLVVLVVIFHYSYFVPRRKEALVKVFTTFTCIYQT